MTIKFIQNSVLIAGAAAACYWLSDAIGAWPAIGVWVAISTALCLVGTALLVTSEVNRVTWKNRLAGYLIPWGGRLNRGRLWPLPVASGIVWVLIGLAAITLAHQHKLGVAPAYWLVLLFVAWTADGAALLYVLGTCVRSGNGRLLWKPSAILVALIVTSIALLLISQPVAAAIVAGGPPLVAGTAFGLFFGELLTFGRNARWN